MPSDSNHRFDHLLPVAIVLSVAAAIIAGAIMLVLSGRGSTSPGAASAVSLDLPAPQYIGSATCLECHAAEFEAWQGSHHDLAMQPANEQTVLGDFGDVTYTHDGVTTRFFREGSRFMVEAQGADGATHRYEARYTFGVAPLQQYLLELPSGRFQTFTVAWDSRPNSEGGQRWFALHPDEHTPPGDDLHWTAPVYNWNFSCAECHSTNLQKNYDADSDTYTTTWSEIDVSCEACHGPASNHVELARLAQEGDGAAYPDDHALVAQMSGRGEWKLEPGAAVAWLVRPGSGISEVESCGRCHARRSQLTGDYEFGRPLSETHRVQLLTEDLYHADGQILDEVFVYGSFRQSRMHEMGVTCSDCHEPHSLKLRAEGNAVCTSCHASNVYDTERHHFHDRDAEGGLCVECHMPSTTYMVVDPRRDHSMRIPRPDLTVSIGTPNACNTCHTDESAQWAAEAVAGWYGEGRKTGRQTYAEALHNARIRGPRAGDGLMQLILDESAPEIARATALAELGGMLRPESLAAIEAGLAGADPLIRRAAIEALQGIDRTMRWRLVSPLLTDPVLGVRLAAAGALEDVRVEEVEASMRAPLQSAFDEYVASQRFNADRAESWVNLAGFHVAQGELEIAIQDFAEAKRRNPRFIPAYVNEADLAQRRGDEDACQRILRAGLELNQDSAALHHALGLAIVRQRRYEEGRTHLERAFALAPDDARFGFVYGVALDSLGDPDRAIGVWTQVLVHHPNNRETLSALAQRLADMGRWNEALSHADQLAELEPDDASIRSLQAMIRASMDSEGKRDGS